MAFVETRLNTTVRYGFTGGPMFNTRVRQLANGAERRNRKRDYALWNFKAPYQRMTPALYAEIYAAFLSVGGKADGFRFKDWADYSATGQSLGAAPAGTSDAVQLVKTYAFGSAGYTRIIKKPVAGTVTVYLATAPVTGTIDTTTGLFTPSAPWGSGALTGDFEFDVPVRFDTDYLPWNYEDFARLSADIPLVELQNP